MHLGFVKNSKDVVLITEEAPKEVPQEEDSKEQDETQDGRELKPEVEEVEAEKKPEVAANPYAIEDEGEEQEALEGGSEDESDGEDWEQQ